MGIPVYFKEITEQYPNIIIEIEKHENRLHIYFLILMD